ncbi:MAG: GIY-YIG nuclease family protein [Desulfobacteraceae bacterium]|jgi:DNA polymerase-3 subunit epsilon
MDLVQEAFLSIELQDLLVLIIDCQTSGSNVGKSHLLELGWFPTQASDPAGSDTLAPSVRLIQPPSGWLVPPRVARLTGIDDRQLEKGMTAGQVWQDLLNCARRIAARNGMPRCPAVIHYARFEMGFIRKLAAQANAETEPPLEAICTHRIAARLLPTLPRKGLRAVAGYFGHSIGKHKRCLDHLLASQAIWRHLVQRLIAEHGITTLDQLREWIEAPSPDTTARRIYPMPRQTRLNVPQAPGIYRMHRSNGDLLYIGKATNLRQRINSYFRAGGRHSESTLEMLSQAVDLQTQTTCSALEAALLESDEIKRHKPPYNIALTDDHRKLFFLSRDFQHHAALPDDVCRIGPVSHRPSFMAARTIARSLSLDKPVVDIGEIPQILAMPERHCPDQACLMLGLERFRNTHKTQLHGSQILRGLLKIGRLAWIEKMNRQAAERIADVETQPADEPKPFAWNPEAVAKSMTAILRHCEFLIRRARWLAILSESTIAWQVRDPASDRWNVAIFSRGQLLRRNFSRRQNPLASPPGAGRPVMERRRCLNLPTYDRLRVLTTELRRLLLEKRPVCVRLSRGVCLREKQLQRLMRWI